MNVKINANTIFLSIINVKPSLCNNQFMCSATLDNSWLVVYSIETVNVLIHALYYVHWLSLYEYIVVTLAYVHFIYQSLAIKRQIKARHIPYLIRTIQINQYIVIQSVLSAFVEIP